ncbi:MMPL family transporter [Natronobacterium texcoconense]|uniref:Predicted exporter protein, RND superfamily n=1 Tax=Natronobacterium texcoconense TaxID=1095778 RepID=A0A1H1FJP3_NATTX|nr:MMPL family transporter [Natronobacterium texcoconense]SDR01135.1 Predicted exporter protein, RND superfamily [Natronobacterium texcoconense]
MVSDLATRYADGLVARSKLVIVILLLVTAGVAAGAVVNETEDAGIGEFETGSEEEAALEYVEDNYNTDEQVVTQIVVRDKGGDVLTRESLLESLSFQQDALGNESINETVADDDFVGLENAVGIAAHTEDRVDEFEERGEELGERQAELEARSDVLEEGINESREIQREYEQLNATTDETDPEYQEGAAELEAQFEAVLEETTAAADLDDEEADEYAQFAEQAREIESGLFVIEQTTDDPESVDEYGELQERLEGVYAGATVGLLEEEFEALESDFEALEEDREAFEESDGPTLAEQVDALEDRSDEEVEELLADVLDPDADAGDEDPAEFLPADYEPGDTEADSRITFLFQADDSGEDEDPEAAYEAQLEVESLFEERFDDGFVFGQGITDAASSSAVGDSFIIITPVALVLVLTILAITYRDVVDVLLGLGGIAVVMAWLGGLMGWLEIPMSQLLIAVPFLLIGLSIDYALHVVMRYREARAGVLDIGDERTDGGVARGIRTGMAVGVSGVVLALAAATFSTGIGFLSNVVSPLPAIQDFAILSAGGILATFVAFGILVPALKVEVDRVLENRFGRDRAKSPFGVSAGPINRLLSGGVVLARRAPLAVVFLAFLLAVGGAYGATGIDTEFNEADFLPEDAPEWAKSFPEPFAPDTYTISDDAEYLGDNFQDPDSQAEILIRGDVTDPATLPAIEDTRQSQAVAGNSTIDSEPDGSAAVDGPLSVLEDVAADNETVAEGLEERDTTGDDVPDEDLEGLYDLLYDADPDEAATVLERTEDGEYESARLLVSVRGDASAQSVADDTRAFAAEIEDGAAVTAIATGGPVTTAVVQDALLETLVQAFAVTLVVILVFLTVLYWVRHRALSLGAVTLAPVVAALAWLLGAMALLDVPFNSETAVITSLAIGLGVDYSIHFGERFVAERERQESIHDVLTATITGTGGALLGSALTTAAGFGVLALALAPPLRRFGLVTGLSIVFAFLACMTVLPSLLVLRERVLVRLNR